MRVLELGSREVTGPSDSREKLKEAHIQALTFTRVIMLTLVGDIHKPSQYFQGEQFDIMFSAACFEHYAIPWVVATGIAKVLKVGG